MADVFTRKKRSAVMSAIRSEKNLTTELRLIQVLRSYSIHGWRRNFKLKGRPDFVFKKKRLAVFVDGCFWHCCPRCGHLPKSNQRYWTIKLARNVARDRLVNRTLRQAGWSVLRLWECELSEGKRVAARIQKLLGPA